MKAKKVMLAGLAAIMLFANGMSVMASGGCGDYQTYSKGAAICDNTHGCGFLLLKDTLKHPEYQKRTCVTPDNTIYYTYRTYYVKDGCC